MAIGDLGMGSRLRRAKGRDNRTRSVGTKMTASEEVELIEAARADGKFVSEWAREVLLSAARVPLQKRGADPFMTELLSEIVGVRLLLVNLLKPQGSGREPITQAGFEAMLDEIKKVKRQLATEIQRDCSGR